MKFFTINCTEEYVDTFVLVKNQTHITLPNTEEIVLIAGEEGSVRPKKINNQIILVRDTWPQSNRCLILIKKPINKPISPYSYNKCNFIKIIAPKYCCDHNTNKGQKILAIAEPNTCFICNSQYYTWNGHKWFCETKTEKTARETIEMLNTSEGEWL